MTTAQAPFGYVSPGAWHDKWRSQQLGRSIIVGQTFGKFNTIQAGIADAVARGAVSAATRTTVFVGPGIYDEAITMAAFVDVVSLYGPEQTSIQRTDATAVTLAANSVLSGFTITLVTPTLARNVIVDGGAVVTSCVIRDCIFAVTTPGALANMFVHITAASTVEIELCKSTIAGTGASAIINTEAASTITLRYCDLNLTSALGFTVRAITGAATVTTRHCVLMGNSFYVGNLAGIQFLSEDDTYNNVTFQGAAGNFADLSGCRLYTVAAGVLVGEWVYVSGVDTVAEANATALATMPSVGVVVYKPGGAGGLTAYVKQNGYIYNAAAPWVTGSTYWIDTTAGLITATMPMVWPQRAGVATSTVRLKILLGDIAGLGDVNVYEAPTGTVAVGNWVYMTGVANEVAPARANAAATMPSFGVCVAVVVGAPNDFVSIKTSDKIAITPGVPYGFAAGNDVYISEAVAGAPVVVPPVIGIVQRVAHVRSDNGAITVFEIV